MTSIVLKNVNKSFSSQRVLEDINMTIEQGEPIAIIGPNGAGKTTLFSLIAGFALPDKGTIQLGEKTIPCEAQFGSVAVLPQDALLDPRFSIFKQLRFFARLQGITGKKGKLEVTRVLEAVGLRESMGKKPDELSHGMRKRACIAQTLIGNPTFVLLDEATAGLDPVHAREIRELIAELSNSVTFILSSHDLHELERLCTRVYFFEKGKLRKYSQDELDQPHGYLTIRFAKDYSSDDLQLDGLEGLVSAEKTQSKEYILSYSSTDREFDIRLLTHLRQQQLDYQQLYNGKTLENQLFD